MSYNKNRFSKSYQSFRDNPSLATGSVTLVPIYTWIDGDDKLKTTGSVSIDSDNLYAIDHGTDNYFYVSGSTTQKSVFGGDVHVSGTLATSYLSQSIPLFYCFGSASSGPWNSATWTGFTNAGSSYVDSVSNGITRTGSSFTVNRTGIYHFYSSFNTFGTNSFMGFRLTGSNGTLTQRTAYDTNSDEHTTVLNDIVFLTSGSSYALQYCYKRNVGALWNTTIGMNGETSITGQIIIKYVA